MIAQHGTNTTCRCAKQKAAVMRRPVDQRHESFYVYWFSARTTLSRTINMRPNAQNTFPRSGISTIVTNSNCLRTRLTTEHENIASLVCGWYIRGYWLSQMENVVQSYAYSNKHNMNRARTLLWRRSMQLHQTCGSCAYIRYLATHTQRQARKHDVVCPFRAMLARAVFLCLLCCVFFCVWRRVDSKFAHTISNLI